MALFLYNITDVFKRYALTPNNSGVLGQEENCPVCFETYDINGCLPLQIDACGHLIGSRCFRDTVERGFSRCLQDNQPLIIRQDFAWWWIKTICASWWFRTFCRMSVTIISQDQRLLPLFTGWMLEFRHNNHVDLWHLYDIWHGMMIMPKLYLEGFSMLYLATYAIFYWLEIVFKVQYFEYLLLRPNSDASMLCSMALVAIVDFLLFVSLAIVAIIMRQRQISGHRTITNAVNAVAIRILRLPFLWIPYGWLIPLALIWFPAVVYSVAVAAILAAGWYLPRRHW